MLSPEAMDFPGVSHVFQLGAPATMAEATCTDIGRTGRIGKEGDAALLITQHEKGYLRDLKTRNINIENVGSYKKTDGGDTELAIKNAVEFLAHDDEFKQTVVNGILSSFAHIRKEYGVNGHEYLRDNARMAETFGLNESAPATALRPTWGAHREAPRQRYWDRDNSSASGFARRSQQQKNRRGGNSYGGNNKQSRRY